MAYEGIPMREITGDDKAMPMGFANFVACENSDSISPNQHGAFYLYAEIPNAENDSQDVTALLERFKREALSDSGITDIDVEDAERWVDRFQELYGSSSLFYFRG